MSSLPVGGEMSFLVFDFLKSLNQTPQLDLRHKRFIGVNFCEKNETYVGRGKETLPDAVQVQNLCSREGKEELGKKVSRASAGARKSDQAYGESSN